jgi:hypothetical protein
MPQYQFVVMTNPIEGQEDAYNEWYDKTHLPDVTRVPGVTGARRSRLVQSKAENTPRYLAIYDIESDDVQAVLGEISRRAASGEMEISPALHRPSILTSLYELRPSAGL